MRNYFVFILVFYFSGLSAHELEEPLVASKHVDADLFQRIEELTDGAPKYSKEAEDLLRKALSAGNQRALRPLAEMLLLRGDDAALRVAIGLLRPLSTSDAGVSARIGRALLEGGYKEESIGWWESAAYRGEFDAAVKLHEIYDAAEVLKASQYWACYSVTLRPDSSWRVSELRKKCK